jgi:hypothetical protein
MRMRIFVSLALVCMLVILLAGSAYAMESTNYRLDWFVPLTGSGGEMASTHYAGNFTLGQSVSGAGVQYNNGLGYWYGIILDLLRYLPLVLKPIT